MFLGDYGKRWSDMTAEIICVGTELLLGNIVNTNAAFLAQECAGMGISCYYQSVVGDNAGRLEEALKTAVERSDIVILSGGLGPTEDDLTKEIAAKVLNLELVTDERSRQRIAAFFQARGMEPTENNWKQAMIPSGSMVMDNHNGTAPGIIIKEKDTYMILLPGPPNELIPMFQESVVPYLNKINPGIILSRTVKICGIGESKAETMVKDLIDSQTNPTIATYAKTGEVHIRVTAMAADEEEGRKLLKPMIKELESRFGGNIYTAENDVSLEQAVVDLLIEHELTVTCAESCTGGMLSARLINVPGVSEVYKAGFITYSNKAKRKLLGVKKETLREDGAVGSRTAREMAEGAALNTKADVAAAITGIAGPDGGTYEKPVGLVYLSCSIKGNTFVEEYQFNGNRAKVRDAAVSYALILMRKCILESFGEAAGEKG